MLALQYCFSDFCWTGTLRSLCYTRTISKDRHIMKFAFSLDCSSSAHSKLQSR